LEQSLYDAPLKPVRRLHFNE